MSNPGRKIRIRLSEKKALELLLQVKPSGDIPLPIKKAKSTETKFRKFQIRTLPSFTKNVTEATSPHSAIGFANGYQKRI